MASPALRVEGDFPAKLRFLFEPHRYKVAWGGRGGSKSWGFARALLIQARQRPMRILCARETQKSIEESVHKLLDEQIKSLGFGNFYTVQKTSIVGANGSQFIFAGIRQATASNLKSYEACDVAWVEEAQALSAHSWKILIPTIRKEQSEIWVSFNPELETDATYQRFIVNPPQLEAPLTSRVIKIGWQDNPWFPNVLRQEMEDCRRRSEDDYQHVYEGHCKLVVEGAIYRQELLAAEKAGQLMRVPYDAAYPVDTYWDLGFGDNTSIWFAQSIGFEFRFIDHLSDQLKALSFYTKAMQERGYVYGMHRLPWDGEAKELGSGRSIKEQLGAIFGKDNVRCAKKLSVIDGIAAVRAIFPKCYFDREKCADGLQSLRHYRYAFDEDLNTYKREPLHDWASHDADALRTAAVSIKEPRIPQPVRVPYKPATRWG